MDDNALEVPPLGDDGAHFSRIKAC